MDTKELLLRAAAEIKSLRRANEKMSLRLGMFDDLMSALHGKPGSNGEGGMMHPDIVYEIESEISNLNSKVSENP
jgi:hypothetical protein